MDLHVRNFHRSRDWACPLCQETNLTLLPDPTVITGQEGSGTQPEVAVTSATEALSTETPADPKPTATNPSSAEAERLETLPTHPDNVPSPTRTHAHLSIDRDASNTPSTNSDDATRIGTSQESHLSNRSRVSHNLMSSQKPPVLLDTAICILFVLLFAIICRRMV
jgi:ubiquitin-conjugating enzyme E2 J1